MSGVLVAVTGVLVGVVVEVVVPVSLVEDEDVETIGEPPIEMAC